MLVSVSELIVIDGMLAEHTPRSARLVDQRIAKSLNDSRPDSRASLVVCIPLGEFGIPYIIRSSG